MVDNGEQAGPAAAPSEGDSVLPDGYSEFLTHNALKFAEDIGNPNVLHQGRLKRLRKRYTDRQKRKRAPPLSPEPEPEPETMPHETREIFEPSNPEGLENDENREPAPENHEPNAFHQESDVPLAIEQDMPQPEEAKVCEPEQEEDMGEGLASAPTGIEETHRERPMREQRARMRSRWTNNVPSETAQGSCVLREKMVAVKAAIIAGLDALPFSVPEVLKKADGERLLLMKAFEPLPMESTRLH